MGLIVNSVFDVKRFESENRVSRLTLSEIPKMLEAASIPAIVQGGMFRPEQPTELPEGTRVHLVVQLVPAKELTFAEKFARFEELRARSPIHAGGEKFRREDLYDRR
jgi:predicted DNA-binding antitoxin AbrB/MazE fold protein